MKFSPPKRPHIIIIILRSWENKTFSNENQHLPCSLKKLHPSEIICCIFNVLNMFVYIYIFIYHLLVSKASLNRWSLCNIYSVTLPDPLHSQSQSKDGKKTINASKKCISNSTYFLFVCRQWNRLIRQILTCNPLLIEKESIILLFSYLDINKRK